MKVRKQTDTIIVHCSYTPPSMDIGASVIRNWHLERGWSDIGYHYVITRDGTIEDGRPVGLVGAHTKGVNWRSIGICLVGGKNEDEDEDEFNFTQPQMTSLNLLVKDILKTHKGESIRVAGHNEFSEKSCPCFNVPAWWSFGDVLKVKNG
jgi:N-acetylmuramoyl-L-alanine amidase